jgi:peptide/nickel transport system ATP-binding protein
MVYGVCCRQAGDPMTMQTNPPSRASQQPGRAPVLDIADLTISYRSEGAWLNAVRDFSLSLHAGETCGLVGESGSGKTTVVLAIMRSLGPSGRVDRGRILLKGRDLLALSQQEMRSVWGREIMLVPQDPLSALNPSLRVGDQLAEPMQQHLGFSHADARKRAVELLEMVHIADPQRVAQSYPHQISGGMQQRVMIAMALSTEPALLVLDEPTTSLDVTTQAVVLDLVRELIRGRQTTALYISHNLGVVAQICDRVAVLYAGDLVEAASTVDLFRVPLHPYSQGLLDSVPRLGVNKAQVRLRAIQGQIPALGERPPGCVFIDRCPLAAEICEQRPPLYAAEDGRLTRCHRWEEIFAEAADPRQPLPAAPQTLSLSDPTPVLEVSDSRVYFPLRRSLMDVLRREQKKYVRAVDGVSLAVPRQRTLGLVGESGSGKTTLARALVGLVEKSGGEMALLEIPLPARVSQRDLDTLSHIQMVFQNPEEALNPYLTIGESLQRPLVNLLKLPTAEARPQVEALLEAVRLPASYARRRPAQLSGGEKQRVAIARAFASNPDLLICDEPISSLDVSVQATILNLINELQTENASSVLFISHDLAVVGFLADDIAVIYLGKLMEVAPTEALFKPPYHPYTEALLSAIPLADPESNQEQIRLPGDLPKPSEAISGCPFHSRCPRFLGPICVEQTPPWQADESGKRIFCHIPLEQLREDQTQAFKLHNSHASPPAGQEL